MRIDDSIDVDANVKTGDYTMKEIDYLDDSQPAKKAQQRRNIWKLLKYPVYAAFGFGAAFLLFRSYGIYQTFFANAGLKTIGNVCTALQPFPGLGWILSAGCGTISQVIVATVSLITLIALTIIMSIPLLLYFDSDSIESMVYQLRGNQKDHQAIQVQSGDNHEIHQLVSRHKTLPDKAIRTLNILAVVAFFVEGMIVYFVRGWDASIFVVLIDSLGFDLLLTSFFMFRNAFLSKPKNIKRFVN